MRWIQIAAATAAAVQSAVATTPVIALTSDQTSNIPERLDAVAVDLLLNVPGQVHIGTYKQVSNDLYVRDLPWVNVYFSLLQLLPLDEAAGSVVRWQFRGYECSPDKDKEDRICSEFTATKLESDRDQEQLRRSQIPHVIARQSPLTDEERRLQFENPETVAPPTFATQPAYYNCAYSGGGSNWCCAQSNQGSGGPYCWSLSTCTEEWSAWNQQNIICCTSSAGDCALTYQPVMPTTTTTAPVTTTPVTSAPVTEDPFGDIPILVDTTPPATIAPVTSAPVTRAPVTSAPVTSAPVTSAPVTSAPVTSAPVTSTPITSAPATPDPFGDIPILADTTTPATSVTATVAPVTNAPVTSSPVTSAPITRAPVTNAPVTSAPVTSAPVTSAPVTRAPVTSAPVTSAP
ncbi:hypothetical protein PHYPSEUDO_009100, partial [Phytophthora pseudosyringae]